MSEAKCERCLRVVCTAAYATSCADETYARALAAESRLAVLAPLLAAWRAQVEADIADGFAPSAADQALLEAVKP